MEQLARKELPAVLFSGLHPQQISRARCVIAQRTFFKEFDRQTCKIGSKEKIAS